MRIKLLKQRRRRIYTVRLVGVVMLIVFLTYVSLVGIASAAVVTPCSPDLTPPTPTGTETEQERQTEKWRRKEVFRQELCSQAPVLKYAPYAYEVRKGEWTFRFFFFLRRD